MLSTDGALLTDLYQLNMLEAYLDGGEDRTAAFEFFVRKLPARRGFLMACGQEQVLDYLEGLSFSADEITWLAQSGRFSERLLDYLGRFRFTGDVDAMPEGTVHFAGEPVVRVVAPLPEAQLVESRLINLMHFQTLIASKAARMVLAAPDRALVDYGLRRAHGAEAAMLAARASCIAGFAGTATVLAAPRLGIPIRGTMAHSFIQAHDDEAVAFERFARARPDDPVLLLDTYDTEAAARKVVELAPRLAAEGIRIAGVRLDSGDLVELSRRVRAVLDEGGLDDVAIVASGGIDEDELQAMTTAGAPIDGYGIGSALDCASDAPVLDCAYKLQEYAGIARRKRSTGKATWPGRKQVWRRRDGDGRMTGDVISTVDERYDGAPLLQPVMRGGRRLEAAPDLAAIRETARRNLDALPEPLRRLDDNARYPVEIAQSLRDLAAEVDRRTGAPTNTTD